MQTAASAPERALRPAKSGADQSRSFLGHSLPANSLIGMTLSAALRSPHGPQRSDRHMPDRSVAAGEKTALQQPFDHVAQVLVAHHPHCSAAAFGGLTEPAAYYGLTEAADGCRSQHVCLAGAQPIAAKRCLVAREAAISEENWISFTASLPGSDAKQRIGHVPALIYGAGRRISASPLGSVAVLHQAGALHTRPKTAWPKRRYGLDWPVSERPRNDIPTDHLGWFCDGPASDQRCAYRTLRLQPGLADSGMPAPALMRREGYGWNFREFRMAAVGGTLWVVS